MRAAGIQQFGAPVTILDLPEDRPLAADEVHIEVRAAGVANWDDIARMGDWDVGRKPPMALGVQASGTVLAMGEQVDDWQPGDEVMTHPLPLRDQGTWAPLLVAPADALARKPERVSWEAASVFPVPALTAEQAIIGALEVAPGEQLLVHGAGGVTGRMLVAVASRHGAEVIATAGPGSQDAVRALGARHTIDYHDADWPDQVREISGGGVPAAVNAVVGGAPTAVRAVADGGRLSTITAGQPPDERGIALSTLYVSCDGEQLRGLAAMLEHDRFEPEVAATYRLDEAAAALDAAMRGAAGGAIVLKL
jgi:NADPH:quinone reductase-like Zn-dependent oxidoreductase